MVSLSHYVICMQSAQNERQQSHLLSQGSALWYCLQLF